MIQWEVWKEKFMLKLSQISVTIHKALAVRDKALHFAKNSLQNIMHTR